MPYAGICFLEFLDDLQNLLSSVWQGSVPCTDTSNAVALAGNKGTLKPDKQKWCWNLTLIPKEEIWRNHSHTYCISATPQLPNVIRWSVGYTQISLHQQEGSSCPRNGNITCPAMISNASDNTCDRFLTPAEKEQKQTMAFDSMAFDSMIQKLCVVPGSLI